MVWAMMMITFTYMIMKEVEQKQRDGMGNDDDYIHIYDNEKG